ncbi:hypothetical protein VTJ83DRAFT_6657 [Remersonia thermophila]|uniref:Ubiquitin-like domain-containing protein n=1 Tax=Remersonia thermophila TaxID=72144 RepID=A0ABR4D5F2_9PEZI
MATEVAFAKTFLALLDSKPQKLSPDHVEDRRNYPGTLPYILPRHPNSKPFSKRRRVAPGEATPSTASDPAAAAAAAAEAAQAPAKGERTAAVRLRSPRNPPLIHTLPAAPLSLSLGELKARAAAELGAPVDKLKLLVNKKPVGDTKLLADLVEPAGAAASSGEDGEVTIELGLMVLGGAPVLNPPASVPSPPPPPPPPAAASAFASRAPAPAPAAPSEPEAGPADAGAPAPPPPAPAPSAASVLGTGAFWDDLGAFLRQRVGDEAVASEALGVFKGAWDGRTA